VTSVGAEVVVGWKFGRKDPARAFLSARLDDYVGARVDPELTTIDGETRTVSGSRCRGAATA
jgi:hypothetical protein